MKFIQIGREVVPRIASLRSHKAVIVGVKDETFVVIMKQDKSREIVRTMDIVLTDKVYTREELDSASCEFYKAAEAPEETNDFDRFIAGLKNKIIKEMIKEEGIEN